MDLKKDYGYYGKEIWWYFSGKYRINKQHYGNTKPSRLNKTQENTGAYVIC
ncbi:MAG: hypothetical protein PHY63_06950 [Candidatus Cloacimonetes bacterium]|jgi:hypothetical protein|nr:hypothetical protein [Candidatus Cloacimonadota bacterium]